MDRGKIVFKCFKLGGNMVILRNWNKVNEVEIRSKKNSVINIVKISNVNIISYKIGLYFKRYGKFLKSFNKENGKINYVC